MTGTIPLFFIAKTVTVIIIVFDTAVKKAK